MLELVSRWRSEKNLRLAPISVCCCGMIDLGSEKSGHGNTAACRPATRARDLPLTVCAATARR